MNPEQTSFQKNKGTIDQIFLLRLIISLIRYHKLPLYIGFFDLSKAFDRVSRFLLLKSLDGYRCDDIRSFKVYV